MSTWDFARFDQPALGPPFPDPESRPPARPGVADNPGRQAYSLRRGRLHPEVSPSDSLSDQSRICQLGDSGLHNPVRIGVSASRSVIRCLTKLASIMSAQADLPVAQAGLAPVFLIGGHLNSWPEVARCPPVEGICGRASLDPP